MTADHATASTADATGTTTAAGRARTLAALVLDAAANRRGTALRYPQGDTWRETSFSALGSEVRELARGLLALGVKPGDRVAVLSNTRMEWTLADFAALCAGAVVVPVYQTNSPEECQYVLEHSGAMAIFCEDSEQLAKLRERGGEVPEERVEERLGAIGADDLATIVYTSGTTGNPKGCMLTHGQLRATVDMVAERVELAEGEDAFYVFLPLAHVLTRVVQFVAVDSGSQLAYWRGNPKQIVEDVAIVQPTHLPSVPRIFEKIHAAASAKVEEAGGAKLRLFRWAVGVGRAVRDAERDGRTPGVALRAQHALADRLVLGKVRALFGGRIKLAITGAAPIDVEILSFFHAAGVWVLEGYGMSETCAVVTLNTIPEHKLGTVGRPLPGCEVRIAEDGEVLMRGPNIFKGYYNNAEATRETLTEDGWLHSGDLGELDEDGYLRITGRKKDLIITSSGKNVSPSNIESSLVQCRWISHAVVFGDRRQYLTALLTLDPDEAGALAEKVGASSKDPAELAKDPAVREELQSAVDATNKRFARIEQIKRFAILERDLSQEHEELTPTMKVKRNVVYERHADVFAELYR